MGISYEEAVKAQIEIEDQLLEDPNVVSIGVAEEMNDLGQRTGNYLIQVGVISVENYTNALKHGKSVIPTEYILPSHDKEKEKHIRVRVIKEGQIQALSNVGKAYILSNNHLLSANNSAYMGVPSFFNPIKKNNPSLTINDVYEYIFIK